MQTSFLYNITAWEISTALIIGMALAAIIGFYLGKRDHHINVKMQENLGPAEGVLFGLLGLLMAFTFGMAGNRYDARRQVLLQEANAIGTAILRCDLYNDSVRNVLRNQFKQYVDLRIAYYNQGDKIIAKDALIEQSDVVTNSIWKTVTQQSKNPNNLVASNQMIPAVNEMIDLVTTRKAIFRGTVPDTIVWMLLALFLVCSFFAGYANAKNEKLNKLIISGFIVLSSLVMFITLDLDRPHQGLINLNSNAHLIEELKNNFK
jgi:hypothetical protein